MESLQRKYDELQRLYTKDKDFYEEILEARTNQLDELESKLLAMKSELPQSHDGALVEQLRQEN